MEYTIKNKFMKQLVLSCIATIVMIANAYSQSGNEKINAQIFTKPIKLMTVGTGDINDNLLVRSSDNTIKEISSSSIGCIKEAPVNGQKYVRSNGNWILAPQENNTNLQSVIAAGRTVIANDLSDDSYFSFDNNISATRQHKFRAGYNGLIMGEPFNNGRESFLKLSTSTGLVFGLGNNFLSIGADTLNVPQGSYLSVFFPAVSGTVAVIKTTPPESSTANGRIGEIRITPDYVYICTATNKWVRFSVATW
ncbi:hypothetical protein [Flavobacterium oreochromis]|nr:hypothetical protein [Flavobacterium oreochromis]OWP78321.1 hypothetical protein BWG23_02275 [Flavobacterium oreochromis]